MKMIYMDKNQKLCWKKKVNCRQIHAVMYKCPDRKVHLRVRITSGWGEMEGIGRLNGGL